MDIGMLWYDDTDKTLAQKVSEAVKFYKTKYIVAPTICFTHPGTPGFQGPEQILDGLPVRATRLVQPNNFWLGVEKAEKPFKAPPQLRRRRK